jgi:hypothetical protein
MRAPIEEVTLLLAKLGRRRALAVVFAVVACAAALLMALSRSAPAPADTNPNNIDCRGHVERAPKSPDDPPSTQVRYVFGCSGPITGYQIQPNVQASGFDTEIFALDRTSKQVVDTDSFSCQGDIPGYGINCVGTYGGKYEIVNGTFSIDPKLCDEPRVDPLLTVVYAYLDSKGKIAQAIAGPFDLGRPHGCRATRFSGKLRAPSS